MSGAENRDLLAAEFVLGTLDAEDARRVETLLRDDLTFRDAVAAWERRLAPLAGLVPEQAPPVALWRRIAADTAPRAAVVRAPTRKLVFWRTTSFGALALAAAVAIFALVRAPERASVAVIAPPGSPVFVARAETGHRLRLLPSGAVKVPSGRDLELWALRAGATRPEALGVLPASGLILAATIPAGTQLLVSLEPHGGSPTGLPTGPVVAAGIMPRID